jgi:bacterioferritin
MADGNDVSREHLAQLLNEDLAHEYQAIIGYVVYSQVLSGAQYMDIAAQLEIHAKQELDHALIISRQIDYLGKMPAVTPRPVRTSTDAKEMLRFDLENENDTIRNYRDRVRQCEALGEFAMAEQIRQILVQEQDHQIDLATALGEEVPDVSGGPQGRTLGKRRWCGSHRAIELRIALGQMLVAAGADDCPHRGVFGLLGGTGHLGV